MAFFSELKRRNVFRVAVYYVAVGWLVMQVADVLASVLQVPDWTGRLVFLLLIIGFPIALLLAWAFELTPEGLRREEGPGAEPATARPTRRKLDYVLIGVVAIVAVGYGWNRFRQPGPESIQPGQFRSILVLPLGNLMNDPAQDYFVEGMHEALISRLSKIGALRVISRTTAMRYAGSDKPLPEIARELDVDAVIEGSVLRAGNVVRINAQLVDARNDRHIWAESFDREMDDILKLYAEVTREIANSIRVTLTPNEAATLEASRQIDPDAYELYLKGRHLCGNWSPQEMRRGIDLLQQVTELDRSSAVPHAQLAMCLVDSAFFEYVMPESIDSRARAAAVKAVQLDERLAEAHVALGSVRYYLEFDPASAEKQYLKALELNPNSADTLLRLSWFYAESGRFDEAYAHTRHAAELDPLSTAVRNAMGQVYYLNRDFDLAIEHFGGALELDQSDPSLHYYLALPHLMKGEYERAFELLQSATALSDRAPLYLSALAYAYGRAGMREEALEIFEELQRAPEPSVFNLAVVQLGLGNHETTLDLLERAFVSRNMHLLYLKSGPRFDPLRDDPRFVRLLGRMGW